MIVNCIKGVETFANTDIVDLENCKINITNELKLDIDQLPLINLEGQNKVRFAQIGMKMFIIFEDVEDKITFAYIIEQIINREKMEIKSIYTSTKPFNDNVLKDFFRYKKDFEMENLKSRLDYIFSKIAIIPDYEKDYLRKKIDNYLENCETNLENKKTIAETIKTDIKETKNSELVKLPIEFGGETFNTVTEFCKRFKVPNASFYDQYVHRKIPLDKIVERYKNGRIGKANTSIKFYDYLGKKMTVKELSELSGLKTHIIYNRLTNGWSVEEAVETPEMRRGERR